MTDFMGRLGTWALEVGGPGLLVVAFLDSSFLSLPQANDLLVVWMVTKHPARAVYYASMATLGSLAGCLVMYALGRRGGEAFVRRRAGEARLAWAHRLFERYGVLAVAVPALLPPPAPFKLFVILAGVARMRLASFVLAVTLARGARYLGEGVLAVWFGEQAFAFLARHARPIWVTVGLVVLAAVVVWVVRRRGARGAGWRGSR
jgi:membrane protein YqaA with SNARE-associated domain